MDWDLIFDNTVASMLNAEALYYALAAIGLNIHFGYTGLLNFGQAGFAAMGGYGVAVGVTYFDWPFFPSLLLGLGLAVALALALGIPTLRLRADYLAIVTIASSEVIRQCVRSVQFREVTGGTSGITGFSGGFYDLNPFPAGSYGVGPATYDANRFFLLVVGWTLVVVLCVMVWALMRSPWGRVLRGIREDEDAVRSLGKNVVGYKMQALVLGGVIGAMAGFVFVLANSSVQPDNYGTQFTFLAFTMMILGGAGRVIGPVVGAIVFWSFLVLVDTLAKQPDVVDLAPAGANLDAFKFVVLGAALMALMIWRPQGIFGDRNEVALDAR